MSESPAPRASTARRWIIAAGLLLALVAAVLAVRYVLQAPFRLAGAVADDFRATFNFTPQVKVDQTIVLEQTSSILELATVQRDVYIDHTWAHTWLGSTKSIQIQAVFHAKAGFDLRKPFTVTIGSGHREITASMPPPELLSIEMISYRLLRDESGWWNRVSEQDRESAIRAVVEAARTKAVAAGILDSARSSVEDRLREIAARNGSQMVFELQRPD
jgi:hypothetical protein